MKEVHPTVDFVCSGWPVLGVFELKSFDRCSSRALGLSAVLVKGCFSASNL